jgi:hypothetical protein
MMNVFLGHSRLKNDFSEFEKILIAFGIGSLFEYFMFYLPVVLVNFWRPFLGDVYVTSAILFCSVSAGALFYAIYEERNEKFIDRTKRILMLLLVPYSYFTVVATIIAVTATSWYPRYIAILISNRWEAFAFLAIVSFGFFLAGVFFLWVYVLKLSFKKSFEEELRRIFSKRVLALSIAMLMIVLTASAIIIPLDVEMKPGLFTPHMQAGREVFSSEMRASSGFTKVVFINATRGPDDNVSATYRYYALFNKTYEITLPALQLLSSVYVDNPSNASFAIGQYNPGLPDPTEDWKNIYVTTPDNVTYQADMTESPLLGSRVAGLVFSFGNYSGNRSVAVTLNYWQEIGSIDNIRIDYGNRTFSDMGNGTWTETHTIKITNNSNDTLDIPAMEYDWFISDCVIRNSTRVYLNGTLRPYSELFWPTRLAMDVFVYPGTVSNVTISFLTTRNPE